MKIINVKAIKKVLRLAIFVITAFLSISLICNNKINEIQVDSADTTPIYVSVEPNNATNGEAYPTVTNGVCAKQVCVTIKLSRATNENVTVYYKTFDASASSAKKYKDKYPDYEGIEKENIIFKANETSRTIAITVYSEPYAVNYNNKTTTGWTGRYFYFQLTGIDGNNVLLNENKCEVKCHIAYDYLYKGYTHSDGYPILSLTNGYNCWTKWTGYHYGDESVTSSGDYYTLYRTTVINNEEKNYAVNKGLAYVYVTATFTAMDRTNWQNDMYYYLYETNHNGNNDYLCMIHLDGYLGSLAWCGYKPDDSDNCDFGYCGTGSASDGDLEGSDYKTGNTNDGAAYTYTRSGKKWYCMKQKSDSIDLVMETKRQYDYRGVKAYQLYYTVLDTIRPKAISYWCDKVINKMDNKVQLMIRFSEPVMINTTNASELPRVHCCVGGDWSSDTIDFTYCSGSGSDTLIFETDLMECNLNIMIESLVPNCIINSKHIVDCGSERNSIDPQFETTIPSGQALADLEASDKNNLKYLTLDPRTPNIQSTLIEEPVGEKIKNSVSVTVEVKDFDYTTGSFYYAWSNDCTLTDEIVVEGDYQEIKNKESSIYKINNNSLNGLRFLWVKAISRLGKVDAYIIGPYYFDNSIETAEDLKFTLDDGTQTNPTNLIAKSPSTDKYITFYIDYADKFYTSSILESIDLVWSDEENWLPNTTYQYKREFWQKDKDTFNEEYELVKTDKTGDLSTFNFSVNSVVDNQTIASTYSKQTFSTGVKKQYVTRAYYKCKIGYQHLNIQYKDYKKCYLGIILTDHIGNTKEPGYYDRILEKAYFDSRPRLNGTWNFDSNNSKVALGDKENLIYTCDSHFIFTSTDIFTSADRFGVEIETDNQIVYAESDSNFVNDYFTITKSNGNIFTFVPKDSELISGYYQITLKKYSSSGLDSETQYTETYEFYLVHQDTTKNLTYTDSTNNLPKIADYKVLINKVYTIAKEAKYCYREGEGVTAEAYSTGSPLSFSSAEIARQYLTYLEYQDLQMLYISDTSIANLLNNGSSGYVKASGDDAYTAEVGQTWIRYKRSTWSSEGATASNWVYYYYTDHEVASITISELRGLLKNAIELVVARIMQNYGGETYLNSDFGLSKYGTPTLDLSAVKDQALTFEYTKCGTKITNSYTYNGDTGIYQNNVTNNLGTYVLASTYKLEFSDKSLIYIAQYDGKAQGFDSFRKLYSNEETMLKKIVSKPGVYKIIEVDENGAQSILVYIDNLAPTLKLEYKQKTKDDTTQSLELYTTGQRTEYSIYGTECTVGVISDEIDNLSHITIYYAKSGLVYQTYTKEELEKNEGKIKLENNRYNIEVYDRSGNTYIVKVLVNSEPLNCEVSEKQNSYIIFYVYNRVKEDINSFTIYYNNDSIPVTSVFSESTRLDKAGIYTIEVVDWYGNTYHEVYEFKREIPDLGWRYRDEDGKWVNYDPTKIQDMYITNDGSIIYTIVSSKTVGFSYEGQFELQIELDENTDVKYTSIEYSMSTAFEFLELKDFSFKVSYAKYPEVYAIYNVIADTQAPEIIATYEEYLVGQAEETEAMRIANETIGIREGDIITPETLYYSVQQKYDKRIDINSIVSARAVKFRFDDDTEVYQIKVMLNDQILIQTAELEDEYIFDKYGKYTIEAIDRLNNKAVFRFVNSETTQYEYSIDGKAQVSPISCYEYFDDNMEFNKIEYGNTSAIYKVPGASTVSFLIRNNGAIALFRYVYNGETLNKVNYIASYCYDDKQYDSDGNVIADFVVQVEERVEKQVFYLGMITANPENGTSNGTLKYNQWLQIATIEDDGIAIFVMMDENNKLYFKVDASNFEEDNMDIQMKIAPTDKAEPFYTRIGLSKVKSDVNLENENGKVETNHVGESVYVNGTIKIDKEDVDTKYITEVKAAYSVDGKFKDFTSIYANGEFTPYVLEYEGFYRIIIDNIYGNQTIYNIALSNDCLIVLEMIYYDSVSNTYTSAYENDYFYSNDRAKIDVFSEGITYQITKDGIKFTPDIIVEENHVGIELQGNGSYIIFVEDKFGNNYTKFIEIEYKTLTIPDELLYGFNEKALLRNENYTNRKISVNQNELEMSSFDYICIYRDGEVSNLVLDRISENKIELDPEKLSQCIGTNGDGVYKVVFRDKYGNLASANISYRETPTLQIERQSRIENNPVSWSIDDAINIGVYSNNIVNLLSNSSCYTFTVDSNQSKMPYTFEFTNNTITEGTRNFDVYYLDEYGFEYIFEIHLIRTTINFDEPINFEVKEYDGKKYTQDNLVMNFADEYTCSYTINKGISYDYESGIRLIDDGEYLFTLLDISGNVCYYSVVKDTLVEYAFVGNQTGTEYISSSVISSETIRFNQMNNDSAYISKAYLDGVEQTSYDVNEFKKDGKWEFLLCDEIGNTTVYTMYIITHSMNHFAYSCPKNYQITDLRYNNGDGQKLDYMNQVVGYKSFEFDQDGTYYVTLMSTITNEVSKFDFVISNTPPQAVLSGVSDGDSTIDVVTLTGTVKGDVIYIYKDGKLSETYEVTQDGDTPQISEKGTYKFVIQNLAGNTSEFTFTKKYVANTAGSVLIIVVAVALSLSLFVGVIYRNKSRVDK